MVNILFCIDYILLYFIYKSLVLPDGKLLLKLDKTIQYTNNIVTQKNPEFHQIALHSFIVHQVSIVLNDIRYNTQLYCTIY